MIQTIYKVNDILEIDYKCRNYCLLPYHGHPKGCPNFGVHKQCPPKINLIKNIFDLNKDLYFIIEEFNLKEYMKMMKLKHPTWSILQLKNPLYWQGSIRHKLEMKVLKFIAEQGNTNGMLIYTLLPEAMGVMVINTALKLGIPIETSPVNIIFKIALVGYSLKSNKLTIFDF